MPPRRIRRDDYKHNKFPPEKQAFFKKRRKNGKNPKISEFFGFYKNTAQTVVCAARFCGAMSRPSFFLRKFQRFKRFFGLVKDLLELAQRILQPDNADGKVF